VLLASTGHASYGREIEAAIFHSSEDEVKSFDPHGYGRVDFVLFLVLVHPADDAIVG
jgi:hypothetical protein